MQSEKQYIDLYGSCRDMLFSHSADVMNAVRDSAFADFSRQGFPTRKVERYKYTDMQALFAPDYGLNVNRLDIPAIEALLAKHLPGATMEYSDSTDPALIGGFTVTVGSERLDATVANELKQLSLKLLAK